MEVVRTSIICRYFNAAGGCWFGNNCRFLHIPDKKPICKFFISSEGGCRFGTDCHFQHAEDKSNTNTRNNQISELNADRNNNNMPCNATQKNQLLIKNDVPKNKNETEVEDPIENICCSACKWTDTCKDEDARRVLRQHYIEKFLKKDGQHVKSIKRLSFLPNTHMYWCSICQMSFEKSWSLFQHLADKSRHSNDGYTMGNSCLNPHYETLENIAGLLSGFDLSLVSLSKLQTDISSLVTSDITNLLDSFIEQNYQGTSASRTKNIKSLLKLTNKCTSGDTFQHLFQDMLKVTDLDEDSCSSAEWVYPGFTQDDVDELSSQGIKPWDPEAHAALAVIYGLNDESD